MAVVQSQMSFLEPWDGKEDAPYIRGKSDDLFPATNFKNQDFSVQFHDARPTKDAFKLDIHGFGFFEDEPIGDEIIQSIRERNKLAVEKEYYPRVEALIKRTTGASKVIIFDHTYRKRDPALAAGENPNGREQPATLAHVDQSAIGAIGRVHRHAEEDAERLLQGRVQVINVWRPFEVVEDWPLACADYRSFKDSEIHPTSIFRERFDRQGQTVSINYSDQQRWYYLDHQESHEVTFIKIWDSKDGTAKLCPHGAFQHPHAPTNAKLRESVEVRCLVFYENESQ
ncbi:hypothetical protein PFICI_09673 [Pestalotiopsis fici W106-1]|uniref:Methyltransferase n=1 Tax=Pestalotiopsis fici (strain W106-1 / CGMCC3.15140) TaxID=1229662 RepID=W3WXJ7_PESFW|nr:uncharacterized protein PFICI_09673 [Pestalotiopsis fici W106-1]ETS77611.1 hypothetical protein PFICI_09673 [Pestalotiopsis fici W106-1]